MNNIYSRPMFQNPQQRAGGGIMAGVAPINMQDGGDLSVLDWAFGGGNNPYGDEGYVGKRFSEDLQENVLPWISLDPNDPIDQATIALLAIPGVNVLARLTAMGLKGARLARQLKKVEKVSGKLITPAGYLGTALIGGAVASDPEIQETVSSIGGTLGELGDIAPIYAEQKYDEYFGTPSLVPDSTAPLIAEVEAEDNGGLANLATSIAEARDMKAATFRRDDKELAAVTKEDLEESGFDSLTDYLNNMEFDEDIGRYSRKVVGKANGGIMRLQDGSDPDGVIAPEIQGVLDKWDLSLEEFLEFSDEKKQAYLKTYKDSLDLKKALVDAGRLSGPDGKSLVPSAASGIAGVLDVINMVPEGAMNLYEAAKYSDFGRAVGFSDPDQERPDDDPSFAEDIERIRAARAPSLSEVNALIPAPIVEEKPEQIVESEVVEEKPGFIETAWGAIKDYHGMGGTSENERNAQRVANNTRRKYGTSWQEVYNKALSGLELKDAQVRQANAAAVASGTNQVDEFVQAIKRYRPGITDSEALDLFLSTKSGASGKITNELIFKAIQDEADSIRDNFLLVYKEEFDATNLKRAEEGKPQLTQSQFILDIARNTVLSQLGMDQASNSDSGFSMKKKD